MIQDEEMQNLGISFSSSLFAENISEVWGIKLNLKSFQRLFYHGNCDGEPVWGENSLRMIQEDCPFFELILGGKKTNYYE